MMRLEVFLHIHLVLVVFRFGCGVYVMLSILPVELVFEGQAGAVRLQLD
jgi:hypothetical protein